ncbi:class I adenylate-forming enzyme family protein [uncultured Microbulbifer sp.]|uniref:class I adenylate-forming enzyme family protein n=1 Tax=uncultured Microbulbifer sp. TaxID=348147 RepID=UPI0026062E70|nr:class I adenylate-forming enzyme family protein [uncultured Microbulbifer sp.]
MITSSRQKIEEYEDRGFWQGVKLHDLLLERAARQPDLLALVDQPSRHQLVGSEPQRLTFAELQRASANLAHHLLAQGVGFEDRVIVQLPNIVELVICYLAISRIGAIISPIPVQYGQHELNHIAKALDARAYIAMKTLKGKPFGSLMAEFLGSRLSVLVLDENLHINYGDDTQARRHLQRHEAANPWDANHIFTLCWTSGTTGMPKGVPRSHNMWLNVALNCIEAGDYRPGDVLLNPFPLVNMASVSAFLYPFALSGCTLVLHQPFEPEIFLQQLQNERVSFTLAPPSLLTRLAKNESLWGQFDFSTLRAIGSGSAPLSPWMIEKFEGDYGIGVVNYYGSNEGISLVSRPVDVPEPSVRAYMFPRFGAAGLTWQSRASKSIWTKVVDPNTGEEITQAGVVGELAVKGPTVFDGYWGADALEVFTEDGYFLSGDLVEICGEGNRFYRIAGRCKDIINRGGMKISPSEIDVLLEGLPGTSDVAVCSYADADLGERICACVVPSDDISAPKLDKLVDYLCGKGVARIKLPERLELFEQLPRNPLGKVQRFVLQQWVGERIAAGACAQTGAEEK